MSGNASVESSGRVGSGLNYDQLQGGTWVFNRLRYIKE